MSFILYPGLTAAATPVFPFLPPETFPVKAFRTFAGSQARSVNGRIDRVRLQAFPLTEFSITYSGLRDQTQNQIPLGPQQTAAGYTELQQIEPLYISCLAQYGQFWYTAPECESRFGAILATAGTTAAPNNTLNATTDGTSTVYVPMFQFGSGISEVWEPVGGINTINAVHGTAISYSINPADYRSIVFATPPAQGLSLTIDLSFYFRCHFVTDEQDWSMFLAGITGATLKFRSVKP